MAHSQKLLEANVAVERSLDALEAAERELDAFLSDLELRSQIGEQRYREQSELRVAAMSKAERELAHARQRGAMNGKLMTPGALTSAWPKLATSEKRALLTASLDAVMVRSGRNVPVEDRVLVLWRGEGPEDLPRRGHRVPLASFLWPDETPANVRVPVSQNA